MKKKILALGLALVMLLSVLAGCTPSKTPDPTQAVDPTVAPTEPAVDGKPLEGVTLKVAAIETAYGAEMWQEVAKAFEEETGATVELTTETNLEDVLDPQIQAGNYPDVVHLATGREAAMTEQFINNKLLVDLTDMLDMTVPGESAKVSDKIVGGFTDTGVTNPYGDGHTYLAPMFYSPCGLFYNAGLLEEKGWDLPQTWDEMWELGDKAKAEGIYLFTYPTTGYFDAFFYALMYSVGGPDFYNKALNYEEGIWDTEAGQKCFEIVAKLASYTNPKTPSQANDADFTKNQQLVLDNEAIFMPNGTWIVGEMANATRADNFKWGMCPLPAATAGGNGASYCWLEQAWIPSGSANQDAAKQFVAFLYSDKACAIFAKAGAIQPVAGQTDNLEGDNKMFYAIYDNGADAAMGNFAAYDASAGLPSVREAFFDPVNGLVAGTTTQDQWIAGVKSASDSFRANLVG